jgi:hypothetical protein
MGDAGISSGASASAFRAMAMGGIKKRKAMVHKIAILVVIAIVVFLIIAFMMPSLSVAVQYLHIGTFILDLMVGYIMLEAYLFDEDET